MEVFFLNLLRESSREIAFSIKIIAFSTLVHCPNVSHLAFANYMVIFSNGSKRSLQHLMAFLSLYEKESDHLINMEVSCYIVEGGGGEFDVA